jgi:hypothetical protein
MNLNEDQIKQLHFHINAKQIPYTEVRDEVLDHYQTALENEKGRPMKEVLAELDETFTLQYCREVAESYLDSLKAEYPKMFKEKLFELFRLEKIWIPIILFAFVISLPNWVKNGGVLMHLVNLIMLSGLVLEGLVIDRSYPKGKIKHHYRAIDDKTILAQKKAAVPKGFAALHVLILIIVFVPVLVVHLLELGEAVRPTFFFEPPYVYGTIIGLWLFFLMTLARFNAQKAMVRPQIH